MERRKTTPKTKYILSVRIPNVGQQNSIDSSHGAVMTNSNAATETFAFTSVNTSTLMSDAPSIITPIYASDRASMAQGCENLLKIAIPIANGNLKHYIYALLNLFLFVISLVL